MTSAPTESSPIILIYICLCPAPVQPLPLCFNTHVRTHMRMCVWLVLCISLCISIVFVYCGACMCLWFIYPTSSPPIPPPPPPPVLSVPAGSKGGVSSASLQRSRSDVDVNAAAVAKHRHVGQTRAAGRLPPGSYSSLGKGPVSRVRRLIRERKRWSAWVSSVLVLIKFQTGWRKESVKARLYQKGPTLTHFSAWTGLSPLHCSTLFAYCLLTTLYMFRCGYPPCACCVDEYRRLCLFVSMFPCWPQHLHGSLLDRCSLTNTHCAPLLSCVSSLICLTFFIPFHYFVFPGYWCCLSIFSFLFSWVPFPFISFPFNIDLSILSLRLFPSLSFFHSLSLLLKMMPLIKRMVRSSHSASLATTCSGFFFFPFSSFSLTSFQSTTPPCQLLYLQCVATAPPAVSFYVAQPSFVSPSHLANHKSN